MNVQSSEAVLHVAIAVVVLLFVACLGGMIVWLIAARKIDLSRLISEPNGDASMSRFQLLIFTFVIALSFFLVVLGNGSADGRDPNCHSCPAFPTQVPGSVLALLGISASSYLVSKGIQFSSPQGVEDRPPDVDVKPAAVELGPGQSQPFTAEVRRTEDKQVIWSITPAVGAIDPRTGVYTAPAQAPQRVTHIQVTATSAADANGKGLAQIVLIDPSRPELPPTPAAPGPKA